MVEHSPDLACAIQRHTRACANMHDLLYGALIGLVAQGMSPTPKRRVALCFPMLHAKSLRMMWHLEEWSGQKERWGTSGNTLAAPSAPKNARMRRRNCRSGWQT